MGPVHASSSKRRLNETSSKDHKPRKRESTALESDIPGVQKLKSALRQTRRLLAKDNLDADVRVETERRLRSLEADLQTAERKRKERAIATRYHKIKFFERKKVLRKINQVKRELEACPEDGSASSKKASTQLENALFELRVDLNYITHYPKLEKYISLFPSSDGGEEAVDPDSTEPVTSSTNTRRAELRELIRQKMDVGDLAGGPEFSAGGAHGRDHDQGTTGITRSGLDSTQRGTAFRSGNVLNGVKEGPVGDTARPSKMKMRAKGTAGAPKSRGNEATAKASDSDRIENDDFFDASTGSDSAGD
ncbi:hypothetical protein M0805_009198 [Coniferiporia weirii]|nr:hypothetical protein M0805_009198 [Coniferiporia weirii]